jgi:hypothetical protein
MAAVKRPSFLSPCRYLNSINVRATLGKSRSMYEIEKCLVKWTRQIATNSMRL